MIEINAAVRLKASWSTNRLADAIKGDKDALEDIPKIVDDAIRNSTSSLKATKDRIESLIELGDKKELMRELKALQKLITALES